MNENQNQAWGHIPLYVHLIGTFQIHCSAEGLVQEKIIGILVTSWTTCHGTQNQIVKTEDRNSSEIGQF